MVFSSEYADLCPLRLRGHGEDFSCGSYCAQDGARPGGERRFCGAHGEGGFRPHPQRDARFHHTQSHLHAGRGHRDQRRRRDRLRTLSPLCSQEQSSQGDQAHRRGRDEHGFGRLIARFALFRRQVSLLRRQCAASSRLRHEFPHADARDYSETDRAAKKRRPHRADVRSRAGGEISLLRQVRRTGVGKFGNISAFLPKKRFPPRGKSSSALSTIGRNPSTKRGIFTL